MTPSTLTTLEETITASFIRANVLSVEDAKAHAALAMNHVRKVQHLSVKPLSMLDK